MKGILEYAKSRSIYGLYWITSFRHSTFVFLYSGFFIMYVVCVSRWPKSLCNSACSRPKSWDQIKSVDEFTPHTCLKTIIGKTIGWLKYIQLQLFSKRPATLVLNSPGLSYSSSLNQFLFSFCSVEMLWVNFVIISPVWTIANVI